MEFIQLKDSDLHVSRVALGTWVFGGRRWGNVDILESRSTLQYAVECGINFFDTADAYGEGLSEELLGKAVKQCREKVIIATKVGVVWGDGDRRYIDLSRKHIEEAIKASLRRLQTRRHTARNRSHSRCQRQRNPFPARCINCGIAIREHER